MVSTELEVQDGVLARFREGWLSIPYGFSTMQAGNMSLKFGPDKEVRENREKFLSLLGVAPEELAMMRPHHSDRIVEVVTPSDRGIFVGDGLITSVRGIGLALLPADCFPVIILATLYGGDPVLGLIHAGRQGTRLGIVAKAIQLIEDRGVIQDSIMVFIGPGIHPCCYKLRRVGITWSRIDLPREIIRQSLEACVPQNNVYLAKECTYCATDRETGESLFYSHRRAQERGEKEGRFMAFAALS